MSTIKSYTEKAKAYDSNYKNYAELINRLEDVKEAIKKQNYGIAMDVLCKPYPDFQITTSIELADSEDEKIRKELLQIANESEDSFYMVMTPDKRKRLIAWLERQGNLMKALQISNAKIGELIEKNYYLKEQLEKQGKNNMGISEATKQELEDNLNKALEKETPESCNEFFEKQGKKVSDPRYSILDKLIEADNIYQMSVNDAMVEEAKNKAIEALSKLEISKLLGLEKQGEQKTTIEMKTPEESLGIDSETYNKIVDECVYGEQKPADVRTTGYWHVEDVEQKPAWGEEDIELLDNTIKFIEDSVAATPPSLRTYSPTLTGKEIPFLKALKDRVQPKQEWSEEDEKILNLIIARLHSHPSVEAEEYVKDYHWFKAIKNRVQLQNGYNPYKEVVESIAEMCKHYDKASHSGLRDFYDNVKVKCKDAKEYDSLFPQSQWKPSDEQMEALEKECIAHSNYELCRLLEQLKKLKG